MNMRYPPDMLSFGSLAYYQAIRNIRAILDIPNRRWLGLSYLSARIAQGTALSNRLP